MVIVERRCNSVNNKDWFRSAEKNDVPKIAELIGCGVLVDSRDTDGNTALHIASQCGSIDVVTVLLENGAYIDSKNKSGNTPILSASSVRGNESIINLLLDNDASIDTANNDGTTLIVFLLLNYSNNFTSGIIYSHNLDVGVSDKFGNNPLEMNSGLWKSTTMQNFITSRQPWNIKPLKDIIGLRREVSDKYYVVITASDYGLFNL